MSRRGRFWRFGRVGRRPDHWATPHERARSRAAERLTAPLAAREQDWLEAHLAACVACHAIADMYAKDSAALRTQRDTIPVPPRDLWARTAARIERESAARRTAMRGGASRHGPSLPILSAGSGLAGVALVVVATAVSGGLLNGVGQGPASSPRIALASQVIPLKAALEVDAGTVKWLGASEDGAFAYNVANIDVVCRHDRQPDCAPFEDGHARRVTLTATPRFVFQSPVDDQAVVVGTDSTGADAIIVVPLPTPDPTPEPTAATSVEAVGESSLEPSGSTNEPSPTPSVLLSATLVPIATADTSGHPDGSDAASAEPVAATAVAIIANVAVVGRTAAYSPEGAWFAFTARPADGSTGPDIYVWHVGDLLARPLTGDHASVFASWVGGSLLGSRVGPAAAAVVSEAGSPEPTAPDGKTAPDPTIEIPPPVDVPNARDLGQVVPGAQPSSDITLAAISTAETVPQTFLLDPATGAEIDLLDAEWQPAVDPTGLAVVAWQGTAGIAGDGLTASPATGNLVLHPFHGPTESDEPFASPEASPILEPTPGLSPHPIVDPSAPPSPSASPTVMRDFPPQIVANGLIADFDARWDETGTWLAIWIADPVDGGLGRLSLLRFDPFTGLLDRPEGAPQDVTALPGFSIALGRLAWASPPGQGGEGSRIQIAAWTADEVGAIESIPVTGAIVVQ